MAQKFAQYII